MLLLLLLQSLLLLGAGALAALLLRRVCPPWLGRPALLVLPLVGALRAAGGQREFGLLLALCGFMLDSRDLEVLTVASSIGMPSRLRRNMACRSWSRSH